MYSHTESAMPQLNRPSQALERAADPLHLLGSSSSFLPAVRAPPAGSVPNLQAIENFPCAHLTMRRYTGTRHLKSLLISNELMILYFINGQLSQLCRFFVSRQDGVTAPWTRPGYCKNMNGTPDGAITSHDRGCLS